VIDLLHTSLPLSGKVVVLNGLPSGQVALLVVKGIDCIGFAPKRDEASSSATAVAAVAENLLVHDLALLEEEALDEILAGIEVHRR
jgi:hypothetical protein